MERTAWLGVFNGFMRNGWGYRASAAAFGPAHGSGLYITKQGNNETFPSHDLHVCPCS